MPDQRPQTRFIFVTGGVVSALGKGIAAASIGRLLVSRGFTVALQKFDPYINVDPGTMSPFQHGEVFVTEDGAETDLDLGHYERFTDTNTTRGSNVIGAVAGVWLILTLTTTLGLAVAAGVLALITLFGEFRSISAFVERTPGLRQLDLLGRSHA